MYLLDMMYHENPLTPSDPYQRAQDQMLMARYGKVVLYYRLSGLLFSDILAISNCNYWTRCIMKTLSHQAIHTREHRTKC